MNQPGNSIRIEEEAITPSIEVQKYQLSKKAKPSGLVKTLSKAQLRK